LKEAYDWAAKRAPQTAASWLNRFEQALRTLERQPQSHPLARESKKADVEIREFLFGKRPWVFRSLFTIDGDKVRILCIRRAQRRPLSKSDLRKAIESDE
jgi:plasmid stabilization system protein ParE